jgi:prophage tail gpP-like protein
MPYPNPLEIAVITSGNIAFQNWETVWIQERWTDSTCHFRFTCSEFSPLPTLWTGLKFLPGDIVQITLGGVVELKRGLISDRQVAYDANSHAVELTGVALSWQAATSSVDMPGQSFDGMSFEMIARTVLAKYGQPVKVIADNGLNPRPFVYAQPQKGETVWDFLESLARPRGIILGSDNEGNFLLISDHFDTPVADLVEGVNILKCQCVISIQNTYPFIAAENQTQGDNDVNMADASEQRAPITAGVGVLGINLPYRNLVTVPPHPTRGMDELFEVAKNEATWANGTIIKATITTQGWMRPGSNPPALWHAGETVRVWSPMAVLDMPLAIETATFSQDRNSGTLTTLELVVPWLLKKKTPGVIIGMPTAPGPAQTGQPPPTPVTPLPPHTSFP